MTTSKGQTTSFIIRPESIPNKKQISSLTTTKRILTVKPRDRDGFEEDCREERQSGHVGLQQVEDVHSSLPLIKIKTSLNG